LATWRRARREQLGPAGRVEGGLTWGCAQAVLDAILLSIDLGAPVDVPLLEV
jgi:hypothetical protein